MLLQMIFAICFLFQAGLSIAASSSYDAGTNTITLGEGNNTLNSIYNDVSNPAVLSYDGAGTYVLSANISGENGVDADLVLEECTLIFNDALLIKTWSDLVIRNVTIRAQNPSASWKIWAFARYTTFSLSITGCDISGGQIVAQPNGYQKPSMPIVIENNLFHDLTIDSNYMLSLGLDAADHASIANNTFENIHQTSSINYDGIIKLNGYTGLVMDKVTFSNCSVPANSYGMIYFYGTAGDPAPVVSNITMQNCQGLGFSGKEYGNVVCRDSTFTNISRDAVRLYHSKGYGNTQFWIWDVVIDGANTGICENGADFITTDIYNVIIKNVNTVFKKCLYGDPAGNFYITNATASNYTTLYSAPSGEIRVYELADVYVTDKNDRPVNDAQVFIKTNDPNLTEFCINRKLQFITSTSTFANGHTPLPQEDASHTLALLRLVKTNSAELSGFTYTITASKEGFSNAVEAQPESSWYRIDPDTYQKTITIVLPIEMENGVILGKTTVFPNPYISNKHANGKIVFARLPREATVRIYSLAGILIKEMRHQSELAGGSEQWDIRQVAGGIYLYVIVSSSAKIKGKIAIIK